MREGGQGEVVPDSPSPESRLSGDIPSKALDMGIEIEAESFQGVDEGEVMVEVVGSDVLVDGVSSHQEGDLGSGEVEDLVGCAWEQRQEPGDRICSEEKNVPVGESGDKILDCGMHLSEPRDEKICVSEDGEACARLEKRDGVSNGNCNQVTESIAVSLVAENDGTVIHEGEISEDLLVASDHMDLDIDEKFDLVDEQETSMRVKDPFEVGESKEPFLYQCHHIEATVTENNETDSSKSNGILLEGDPDPGKSIKELQGEPVSDPTHHMINFEKTGDFAPEVDKYNSFDEEIHMSVSSKNMKQPGYLSAPEKEDDFSVGDLVWGKLRSHPWWPGQIFYPTEASDDALEHYKKDSHLVAYFEDQTFAWNDSSLLKPFRPYFTQMEKQSNSQAFQDAINCALEEVSRRVQLGLSCPCISQDAYSKLETQCITNSGIRKASSRRSGVDKSCKSVHFQPVELLLFLTELAPRSSYGTDRLDLVLIRAQLSTFCRFKGYRLPPELSLSEEWPEFDIASPQKNFKHTPLDATESLRERSLSDLMDLEFSVDVESDSFPDDVGISVSFPVSRKRKADYPLRDGSEKRLSTHAARVFTATSQAPKASFKIGECISRVASKLTAPGSEDPLKIHELSDRPTMVVSVESSSLDEMLSQIQLLACHPKKEHSFPLTTHTFLLGLRNSIALSRRKRKKGSDNASGEVAEEFEFHDVNDSYWTDRIVQHYLPEQLHNGDINAGTIEVVPFAAETAAKPGRRSRKQFSTGNLPSTATTESEENAKKQKQESSPAELTMNFEDRKHVPSEISLNKIFRRFGSLMESETEVDHASGRARVIFKRGFDAEVARDSSEKFNLFGPSTVSYQVGYSPLISVKVPPIAPPQPQEDESWMPNAIA